MCNNLSLHRTRSSQSNQDYFNPNRIQPKFDNCLKEHVDVILDKPTFIEWHVGFTTVTLNLYKWVKCGRYRRFSILKSIKVWQGFNVFAALIWNNKFINFQVGKHGFFIHLSTDKRFKLECLESFRPVCKYRVNWNYVSVFFNQIIWLFLFSWTPWYALYLEYT